MNTTGGEPIHYTFLIPSTAFGGLEIQTVERAADAIRSGGRALVVTTASSRVASYARSLEIPVEHLRPKPEYVDPAAIRRLGRMMRRKRSSVCVVAMSKHLSIALLARGLFARDLAVVYYRQIQAGRKKRDPFHDWIYRNLDGAIVLTERMKEDLQRATVLPGDRIEVIPYGVHLDRFDPGARDKRDARRRFGLPEEAFVAGLVGRIEAGKGQHVAVEAFARAAVPGALLVLCGSPQGEAYLEELKARIRALGIESSVRILPFTFEVPTLMGAFDVSLLPSRRETFGLVVIEAMAAGLPVIATRAGGVPEIVDHGETGLLFDPGDTETLARHIRRLAEDASLRESLGRRARKAAEGRYDYAVQADRFLGFCRAAAERRRARKGRRP